MGRHALAAAALAIALVSPASARADDDYLVDHRGWNGLSMLAGLARGLGYEVVPRTSIEWDSLGPSDVVLVLYPTQRLEPHQLVAFVRNGGRVLIADDFGHADEVIERLSMLRRHGVGVGASTFYDDLSYAPVAKPTSPRHPLAVGVDELTCNHPAVLENVRGHQTVFAFGEGEAVVVTGDMGYGRFVVLSDPSVLINRMLEFEGNFQFARNLLGYLARSPGAGRVVILTADFQLRGEPTRLYTDGDGGSKAEQGITGLNRWLEELNDYFLTELSLRVIAVVAAVLIIVLALSFLPFKSRVETSGTWTRARPDGGQGQDFASLVDEFDAGKRRQSFQLPAAVVRDSVADKLEGVTGLRDPLDEEHRKELLIRLRAQRGDAAIRAFLTIEPTLRTVPTRAQASSTWQPVFVAKRDFTQLVAHAEALYRTLETENHGS